MNENIIKLTQAARDMAMKLKEESNEVSFASTASLMRDSAAGLVALANVLDSKTYVESTHDRIIAELKNTCTQEAFIAIGYKYNLVCVATASYLMNVYMVPYDGGTTIITRYESGKIKSFRVGAEIAQMLLDIGVNDDKKWFCKGGSI